jgi:hypothetical protein
MVKLSIRTAYLPHTFCIPLRKVCKLQTLIAKRLVLKVQTLHTLEANQVPVYARARPSRPEMPQRYARSAVATKGQWPQSVASCIPLRKVCKRYA